MITTNQQHLRQVSAKPSDYSLGEIATICEKAATELELYKTIIGELRDAFRNANGVTK